jgi:hypothetical protein
VDPILTLAGTSVTQMLAYAGQLFTDLESLVILAVGLPVGFWVINKAIGLVRGRAK